MTISEASIPSLSDLSSLDPALTSFASSTGYGSEEMSMRATKKPTASSSTAKRKPTAMKPTSASSSKSTKASTAARGGAARGRGKAAATRTKGRSAVVESVNEEDEENYEDEPEVIDIEADIHSADDNADEDVVMEEPEPVRAGRPKRATGRDTSTSKPIPESKATKGKGVGLSQGDDNMTSGDQDLENQLTQVSRATLACSVSDRG